MYPKFVLESLFRDSFPSQRKISGRLLIKILYWFSLAKEKIYPDWLKRFSRAFRRKKVNQFFQDRWSAEKKSHLN